MGVWQSAGGKATAIISRKRALDNYYANPSICKNCNQIILVKDHERCRDAKNRIFCSKSCFATYNKLKQPKADDFCVCGSKKTRKALTCRKCRKYPKRKSVLLDQLKGNLISKSQYWIQWRNKITHHARKTYIDSKYSTECAICGYSLHTEICHIQSVSDFSKDAQVSEINHIENLIPLCKNHHWEFDHGFIPLEDILEARKKITQI